MHYQVKVEAWLTFQSVFQQVHDDDIMLLAAVHTVVTLHVAVLACLTGTPVQVSRLLAGRPSVRIKVVLRACAMHTGRAAFCGILCEMMALK